MLHPASGSQGVIAGLGATTVSTQAQATCGGRERLALAPTLLSQSPSRPIQVPEEQLPVQNKRTAETQPR